MNKVKKLFVFDFDGVVCDSTDECMVTSWNAWEEWESRDNFRNDLSEFSENYKSSFRKVRPRVRGAGEYYILCRALSEGISIDNQKIYEIPEIQYKKTLDELITHEFKLDEINKALNLFRSGEAGRIVIRMD